MGNGIKSIDRGAILPFLKNNLTLKAKNIRNTLNMLNVKIDFRPLNYIGPCVVFGSAPKAIQPNNYNESWILVTANAAQVISDSLGCREPDITVMSSQLLYDKQECKGAQRAISGRFTNNLLLVESGVNKQRSQELLADLKYTYKNMIIINVAQRAKLTKIVYGKNLYASKDDNKLSTGLYAVTVALYLGLKPVVMTGFSLSDGKHGYKDDVEINRRNHHIADKFAIDYFIANDIPVYAADERFAQESGLKIWNGSLT